MSSTIGSPDGAAPTRGRDRITAALLRASRGVDTTYSLFLAARTGLALRFLSDQVLRADVERVYERSEPFQPDLETFREGLFAWEVAAIERHFPAPPARILLGGAGGGRELFALAHRGYQVAAFEPSAKLAALTADWNPVPESAAVYRAGYEDLPWLSDPLDPARRIDVRTLPRFDAVILGWGSLSHLRTPARRLQAILDMASLTDGPMLLSFATRPDTREDRAPGSPRARLRRLVQAEPGTSFSRDNGLFHLFTEREIRDLLDLAGLELLELTTGMFDAGYPHAVARRAASGTLSGPEHERA